MSYNEWFQKKREEIYDRDRIANQSKAKSCVHNNCSECQGTGRKKNGEACVHMISCPCPKCSPSYFICRKEV